MSSLNKSSPDLYSGVKHLYRNTGVTVSVEYVKGRSYEASQSIVISYMMALGRSLIKNNKSLIAAKTISDVCSNILSSQSIICYEETEILGWLRSSLEIVSSVFKLPEDFKTVGTLLEERKYFLKFDEYLEKYNISFDEDYFNNICDSIKNKNFDLNKHQIDIILVFYTISLDKIVRKEYECCLITLIISIATKGFITNETLSKIKTIQGQLFCDTDSIMNFNFDSPLISDLWYIVNNHIICKHITLEEITARLFICMGKTNLRNIVLQPFIEILIQQNETVYNIEKIFDKHFTSKLYWVLQRHLLFKKEFLLFHEYNEAVKKDVFSIYSYPYIAKQLPMLRYLCAQVASKIDGNILMTEIVKTMTCPWVNEVNKIVELYEKECEKKK